VRIAFSLLSSAYLKNFESVVTLLADRGHRVSLITHERSGWAGSEELGRRLEQASPNISFEQAPPQEDVFLDASAKIRACSDYVQFLDPKYNDTYRARAVKRVPKSIKDQLDRQTDGAVRRRLLGGALAMGEMAVPPSPAIERFMARLRPDIMLLTPYVGLSTIQPAYLRAARASGAHTVVCVGSWDHLTSKSRLRPMPDLVTVWNETQKAEAIELHGVPESRVAVTGAQCFDQWFNWEESPRGDFCERIGLDPERPYVLYTCFSPFKGGANEAEFVQRWIRQLRSRPEPELQGVGVLIRPHPKRIAQWQDVDLSGLENVVCWPREPKLAGDRETKAGLYDSIKHSACVVGINTSAMIEAGIVGRRVHTILAPEYYSSQMGTFHFPYMLEVGGGLVEVAQSFGEHFEQLATSIAKPGRAEANRGFVESFVRPHGIDVESTPRWVEAIEALGPGSPRRVEGLRTAPVVRRVLAPALARATTALR